MVIVSAALGEAALAWHARTSATWSLYEETPAELRLLAGPEG
ncbi:MAG: hypothetical protein AB7N76_34540 [Planctomycetota bacterium]